MKIKLHITLIIILSLVWFLMPQAVCLAATYYVHEGESIQAMADIAQAGDTIIVREGVYHEEITLRNSGTEGNYIIIKAADGEGVLLDGSVPLTEWTQCESPAACWNNPNWQNIYYATIQEGVSPASANLYEGETLLQVAQDPDPSEPLYFKVPDNWMIIPSAGYTNTQIVDPSYFTQSDPNYWDKTYVLILSGNNNVFFREILSFDPVEHKITFDQTCEEQWLDPGKDKYALWNHPSLINHPGEYYVDETNNRIYLWPHSTVNLDKITVSTLEFGFFVNSQSYVIIDGFKFRRYSNQINGYHMGVAIRSHGYHQADHIIFRNNEITQLGFFGYSAIYMAGIDYGVADNNYIHDVPTPGIFFAGPSKTGHAIGNTVSNNRLERVGGTGIRFYTVAYSSIINNTNTDSTGQHANGMTCYLDCHDILISKNKIINCNVGLTMNTVRNMTITHNIFKDSTQTGYTALCVVWNGIAENVLIDHNTVLNSAAHCGISVPTYAKNVTISNNITDGIALPGNPEADYTLLNNLYVGLTWNMSPEEMGEGGILETNLDSIFVDYNNGDFRLKEDSPAIDVGTDVTPYLPIADFPDFDFYTDIEGNPRPYGMAYDIGAYEYTLLPRVVISAKPNQGYLPLTVLFSISKLETPNGEIEKWEWDFGDGAISHEKEPSHTYTSPGEYTVTLIVTDIQGYRGQAQTHIIVLEKEKEFGELPTGCYNNVFNPAKGERALIVVELSEQARVKLDLYNTKGNKIRELADEEKEADVYKYYWDGKDDNDIVVGSGLYFVHIQAGDYKKTKKIVVVK